jgi:hypothetical protein
MSEYSVAENKWKDRVIIGRLDDGKGDQYYGFRLKNENNEIVMDTNDRGELYLKNKLRISNFSDSSSYYGVEYIEVGDEIVDKNNNKYTTYYRQYTTGTIQDDAGQITYSGDIVIYYSEDWLEILR